MNRLLRFLLSLLCLASSAVLLQCGGVATSTENAPDGGAATAPAASGAVSPPKPPVNHRPAAQACTASRPPGTAPGGDFGGDCAKDADCTQGKNGRCVVGANLTAVCSYDECATDGDCPSGVCECRSEAHYEANVCFRGNCITDADCGGEYCSPSGTDLWWNCVHGISPGSFGYFCHTASDACRDSADCGDGADCLYSPDHARWDCRARRCTRGGAP